MENEMLSELVWIKWLLITIVAVIAISAISLFFLVKAFSKIPEQIKSDVSFEDRARTLLDQGKSEEVIGYAENRISKFPADAQAHWALGQACYRVGDLQRALSCLYKAQELQPGWEGAYTGPLIRVIEERLAEGSAKPELKVVTPNSFERDTPPNGDTPRKS